MAKSIINRPKSIIDDAWLGLGNLHGLAIDNPLLGRSEEEIRNPGLKELKLMCQPGYLSFAAKILLGLDLLPEQAVILEELWIRPFPMFIASRGAGKSFLLAVYCTLKCALIPGTKIVVVGAAFRQSRVIFDYMVTLFKNAPVLRSICTNSSGFKNSIDRCEMIINNSKTTFIPLGDGSKIRGLRADTIIADEFASVSPAIYETVIAGFAAVSAKPIDNVKAHAAKTAKEMLGEWSEQDQEDFAARKTNQCIISGTADYDFMHFADYWKKYYTYIKSKGQLDRIVVLPGGDHKTLRDYFTDGNVPVSFDYRDYGIIRLPYHIIPKGFMDDKVVARAKASTDRSIYLKEYAAVFPKDSDGFFKRSTIEATVAREKNVGSPGWPSWCPEPFDPLLRGLPNRKYVIGIDPAAAQDNLAAVVLELWPEHTRLVYVWTTNMQDFTRRKESGLTKEHDYYAFCARRIRNLAKVFPTENIVMDMQGGGMAIVEALHDPSKYQADEQPWWITNEILYPDRELDTDSYAGKHIIHPFQFANYEHTSEANHGTRKDLTDKVLLFPRFDSVQLEISAFQDNELAKALKLTTLYDTLEDAVMEIESLKDELCTIIMTRTGTGVNSRDRWDTPETMTAEGKKTRLKKDRYSAFIMANYIARSIQRAPAPVEYNVVGGFAHNLAKGMPLDKPKSTTMYEGPDWFVSKMGNGNTIAAVTRKSV